MPPRRVVGTCFLGTNPCGCLTLAPANQPASGGKHSRGRPSPWRRSPTGWECSLPLPGHVRASVIALLVLCWCRVALLSCLRHRAVRVPWPVQPSVVRPASGHCCPSIPALAPAHVHIRINSVINTPCDCFPYGCALPHPHPRVSVALTPFGPCPVGLLLAHQRCAARPVFGIPVQRHLAIACLPLAPGERQCIRR